MTAMRLLESRQASLTERILDCFPGGSYALSALLRLMDIVESDTVPTAAVECQIQPRLLINPDFARTHATTSEKLLMLVMHELHHVLLGHTTMFPTVTPVQNFVFDAVINGIICRMFPAPEYTSFLTGYYDAAQFPHCLLRPPPGWPDRTRPAPGISAPNAPDDYRVREVHEALYSAGGATYSEVFDLLPKLLSDDAIGNVPLLGGHGKERHTGAGLEHRSPVLFDVVRSIVEQWPQPPDPIRGRSLADVLRQTKLKAVALPPNRAILRRLISKVAGANGAGAVRRARIELAEAPNPIPRLDRRSAVLCALGGVPLLHTGQVPWRRMVRSGERVHVYLDVSGSMDTVKAALYGAAMDCEEYVHPVVHLFSTKIADVTLPELRRGICKSTGGTDIVCVARHMEANRIRRALIVTDGWVGPPRGKIARTLSAAKLAVAFLGSSTNQNDLADVANFTALLTLGEKS